MDVFVMDVTVRTENTLEYMYDVKQDKLLKY